MKFLKFVLLISVCLLTTTTSYGQVRKYSNEFLNIGVGGRALGMANSQIATVKDVTAGYWNPAGLTRIETDLEFSIMHSEYFAGIAKFDYGSFAIPLKGRKRFVGLSILRFAVDDIPNTLQLFEADGSINYDNVRSFSVGDYAFLFSYAEKLPIKGLSVGGNVKVVYRTAGSFATAWGFGLDAGLQYQVKNFQLGFMARDVTSTFNAWSFNFTDEEKQVLVTTGNQLPDNTLEITVPRFIFGAAYEFIIKNKFKILPEINFEMTTDGKRNVPIRTNSVSIDPKFGLELNYIDIVYIRGGIGNIQKSTDDFGESITTFQPNIGVGLKIKAISIDYAFTDIGNASEALFSHVFSLNLSINKRAK